MNQSSPVGSSGSVVGVDSLNNQGNINFIFAKLQMELAALAKEAAMGHITQIQDTQKEQKEVADMLQTCRQLQNQAKTSGKCTEMPKKIREYMDTNKLAYDMKTKGVKDPNRETADRWHNKDEWDVAIKSLENRQETLGTDVQTQMVYVQDFMGQYNSYTQGSNSAIQSGIQTLTSVARGQ